MLIARSRAPMCSKSRSSGWGSILRRALVIGDTPYDAIAARRAGLRAVGVLCGGFPEKDLRDEGCVKIYRDPADLLDRL